MGKGTEIRNGHMNPEQNNQMTEENRWCGPGVRRGTCGQVGVDSLPHITQLPSLTSPPPPPSQQPATLPNITLPSSLTTTQHHLALLPHNTVSHHSPPPSHHPATLTHPLVSLTSHHFALLTPGFYMSPGPTDAWAPYTSFMYSTLLHVARSHVESVHHIWARHITWANYHLNHYHHLDFTYHLYSLTPGLHHTTTTIWTFTYHLYSLTPGLHHTTTTIWTYTYHLYSLTPWTSSQHH
ncbi:hypothetical protein Pmani_003808 [Petrolisthes manimaculis]|uniref:Uncharacterized protein n=1 Tax=Petrolisthes manimaculis TaxID=1843537 RepID=A0AAE1QFT2_9EUCA|nr:hypothetical protein Pmani_003808 [Petrolisthes manimaculis]